VSDAYPPQRLFEDFDGIMLLICEYIPNFYHVSTIVGCTGIDVPR